MRPSRGGLVAVVLKVLWQIAEEAGEQMHLTEL